MAKNYLNNPKLKSPNVHIEFTEEQVREILKCKADPIYFIKTYCKVVHVDRGIVPFELWDFQEEMVQTFKDNRFVITKCPRQVGKTTCTCAYFLWEALFHPNKTLGIFANKGETAREILGRVQLMFENIPRWLQQGVAEWNKGSIEFENGSRILAFATAATAARGYSYNIILLDEFSHVPANVQEEFFTSVYPTISSGKTTKVIIVSTPRGIGNLFYKMWTDAVAERSKFVPFSVNWWNVPGRDENWKKQEIANTSPAQFQQEHGTEFLGSTDTLISGAFLAKMTYHDPIESKEKFDIHEHVIPNHKYCIVVDVAQGKGMDYSAFTIIDITRMPYKVVAKYRNNTIAPLLLPDVIYRACRRYNDAILLVEVNDIGGQIAEAVQNEFEYENILMAASRGRAGQVLGAGFGKDAQFGVKTTKQVKRIGCSVLKTLIEESKLIVEDFDIIAEFSTFVSKSSSFEAEPGTHDDLVMTLVLFGWLSSQKYFQDLLEMDFRKELFSKKIKEVEEDLMPFGFIDNGDDDINSVIINGNENNYGNGGFFDHNPYAGNNRLSGGW